MHPSNTLLIAIAVVFLAGFFTAGALSGGIFAWLYLTLRKQDERIAELAKLAGTRAMLVDSVRMSERAQLASILSLVELATRDNLDALHRASPELAQAIIRDVTGSRTSS